MELGISSLAYINDCKNNGKYDDASKLLLDATETCLKFAEKYDIKICEFLLDPPAIQNEKEKQRFVDLCKSFNSIKQQIHGPYSDINLASHNYWNQKASVECYTEIAKICKEIKAKVYTIHPGSIKYLQNHNTLINQNNLIQSVNNLLNAITDLPLTICIENMQRKTGILLELKEIEGFFNNIKRDDIFFTWDTSHSWTCDVDVKELWQKLHSKIKNIHIVDNTSKTSDIHPVLGTGKIDFKEIFDTASTYGYNGSMIIEIGKGNDMEKSVEFIQKFF